jgi:hypothetical protein
MTVQQLDFDTWTEAQTYPHAAPGQTEAAKQEGMTRAEAGAALLDAAWAERAYLAIIRCATKRREFICDDVWQYLAPEDRPPLWPKPKALGRPMQRAAKDGFIRATDRTRPTKNRARHGSPVTVWASLCFEAESEAV